MDNTKSFSVIDADKVPGNIHIVGVGALGSQVVERLTRLNLKRKMIVYDMDTVEGKNLNNQSYLDSHVGKPKVEAIQDLASLIDPAGSKLRGKIGRVERIPSTSKDIVILALDNYHSRGNIIKSLRGTPLLICGGVSSKGGNVEVVRGKSGYEQLAEEYLSLDGTVEYLSEDLTACGSPISIYHRIGIAASLMCEAVVKYYNNTDEMNKNIIYDVPNSFLLETE